MTFAKILGLASPLLVTFLACGCASGVGKARVTTGGSVATAPSNASGPTKVAVAESATRLVIDAGTKVTSSSITTTAAPTQTVEFPKMVITQTTKSNATELPAPRAPDQTVALAQVNVSSRRPLLYVAIALVLIAIVVGSPGLGDHPTAGLAIGAGALLLFLAWEAASEPWLPYAAGALVLLGAALAVGYEICEMHKRQAAAVAATPPPTSTIKPPVAQP